MNHDDLGVIPYTARGLKGTTQKHGLRHAAYTEPPATGDWALLYAQRRTGGYFSSTHADKNPNPKKRERSDKNLKLVLMGQAGSGKGSIAQRICPLLGIPQISMGDLLREEVAKKSELGERAKQHMEKGELVPDELTFVLLRERLSKPDTARGFILDGFPRDINQAQELEKITKLDAVVYLNLPEEILITRLSTRISCKKCDKIYNSLSLKPKREGVCDACRGELYQRLDDTPAAIKTRLHETWKQTKPLINFYKQRNLLKEVIINDAKASPEANSNRVLETLGRLERLPIK